MIITGAGEKCRSHEPLQQVYYFYELLNNLQSHGPLYYLQTMTTSYPM